MSDKSSNPDGLAEGSDDEQAAVKPLTLTDWLLSGPRIDDLELPDRKQFTMRPVDLDDPAPPLSDEDAARMHQAVAEIAAGEGREARALFDALQADLPAAEPVDPAALEQSLAMLDQSQADIEAGRGQDAKQAIREIAAALGLGLNR